MSAACPGLVRTLVLGPRVPHGPEVGGRRDPRAPSASPLELLVDQGEALAVSCSLRREPWAHRDAVGKMDQAGLSRGTEPTGHVLLERGL